MEHSHSKEHWPHPCDMHDSKLHTKSLNYEFLLLLDRYDPQLQSPLVRHAEQQKLRIVSQTCGLTPRSRHAINSPKRDRNQLISDASLGAVNVFCSGILV
jgi:dihydrodipicolinate reductase